MSNVKTEGVMEFIERWEELEAEKAEPTRLQKELKAEAKANGHDVKSLMAVVKLRKKTKDQIDEEDFFLERYREVAGI